MTARFTIIPCLRYENAPAAINFLCAAFGFSRHAVHADPADEKLIAHAELVWDGGMIMVSSAVASRFSQAAGMRTPEQAGGVTQTIYVTVDDVDAHAAVARAAGAEIVLEPEDQSYGGRGYSVRDCERNVWSFGSYYPAA